MATESGAAIFRAIADFSRLRREARAARKELKDLGDETDRASKRFDSTDTAAGRLAQALGKLSGAARATKKDLAGVGDETNRANQKLGDTDKQATKASSGLTRLGAALQKMQAGWKKFEKSDNGKTLHKITAAGERLGDTLHGIRNKIVAVSGIAVAATASIGPVLGLVGAVVSLSGAVGLVPGVMLAAGVAGAVLKVAFLGVSDVLKNLGERDAKKFEESIKALPEPMRKVARAAWEIQPALVRIKESIQGAFWRGLEVPLKDLAGKYLPMVGAQGTKLAGTFNSMAKEFAGFLGQKSSVADVNAMLTNTNGLFKALVPAVKPLAQAFLDIFKVSSEFLPGMGKGIAGLTTQFAAFIHGARESGKLHEWIATGLQALKDLGAVLVNIGRIFVAVFKAGSNAGRGFFGTLKEITDRIATFLESAKGQEALGKLFDAAAQAGRVLQPIIEALFLALADIIPIFVKVGEAMGPGVVDLIKGLAAAIVSAEPQLIGLGKSVGDLLSAIGNAGPLLNIIVQAIVFAAAPIGILAKVISTLAGWFAKLPGPVQRVIGLLLGFGLAGLTSLVVIGKLAGGLMGLVGAVGKGIAVLGMLKPAIMAVGVALRALGAAALANPIILIIAAIAAIALLIILNWSTVKVWIAAFWSWLKSTATDLWLFYSLIWGYITSTVTDAWNAIWKTVSDVISAIVTAVITGWNAVWTAISTVLTIIVGGVTDAWNAVWKAISDSITFIVTGLTTGWNAAWKAVSDALTWIKDGVTGAVTWVGDKIQWVIDLLTGAFSAAWDGAKAAVEAVCNAIKTAVEAVATAVEKSVEAIQAALSKINSGTSGVSTWVQAHLNPFGKGGLVGGTGRGDTTPIMATPGEYVEPVAVTRKWLPLLRAINPHDTGGPADVVPMLGVNDLLRNAAGATHIAAQVASSVALASGRTAGAAAATGPSMGDVHVTQIIHNPLPEKPSESASKRIGRAAALGVHVALNGAA